VETSALRWVSSQLEVLEVTAERERPWAAVWRIKAVDGPWWLKVNFAETVYETRLLDLLRQSGSALLAPSISHPSQPWTLLRDAGIPARALLRDQGSEAIVAFWCDVLPQYAELQQLLSVDRLLGAGVPDFSPTRLVSRFDALMSDERWFSTDIAPEFGSLERARVLAARPRLAAVADELAEGLPATIQHDDLHDGNVFFGAERVQIIDWGDAIVAHPFSTLLVTLDVLAAQLDLPPAAAELRQVTDAYLEAWRTRGESRTELNRQVDLAVRTGALGRAAGWARALGTPAAGVELDYADAVAHWASRLADAVEGVPA
jgi:hypothetical protein